MEDTIYIAKRPDGTATRYFPSDDAPPGTDREEPVVGDWIHVRHGQNLIRLEVEEKETNEEGEVVLTCTDPHAREEKGFFGKALDKAGACAAVGALAVVSGASKVKELFGGDPIDIDIGG